MARGSGDEGGARPAGRNPERALLDLLGLSARARAVVSGTEGVRNAVREGKVHRVLLAADAAPGQQAKLTPLLEARKIPYHVILSRDALGAAIGRAPVSALGLSNAELARRVAALIAALPSPQD